MAVVVGQPPPQVTVTPEIGVPLCASLTVPVIPPSSIRATFSVVVLPEVTATPVTVWVTYPASLKVSEYEPGGTLVNE